MNIMIFAILSLQTTSVTIFKAAYADNSFGLATVQDNHLSIQFDSFGLSLLSFEFGIAFETFGNSQNLGEKTPFFHDCFQ